MVAKPAIRAPAIQPADAMNQDADMRLREARLVGHLEVEGVRTPAEVIRNRKQQRYNSSTSAPQRRSERQQHPARLIRSSSRRADGSGKQHRHGAIAAMAAAAASRSAGRCWTSSPPERTHHNGDVEPQPLLVHEGAVQTSRWRSPQARHAQRACRGHRIGREHQQRRISPGQSAGDGSIGPRLQDAGRDQIALAPVAEQRKEVRWPKMAMTQGKLSGAK